MLTKSKVELIAKDVSVALEAIAAKHGLSFKRGGGKFNHDSFKIASIEFIVGSADKVGKVERVSPAQKNAYEVYGVTFNGLPPLGTTFRDGSALLTIVGWNTKAPKNPVMLEDAKGKGFKAPLGYVKRKLHIV